MRFCLLALISFFYSLVVIQKDSNAAFYFPHLRAWELAIGSVLAATTFRISNIALNNALATAGIAAILIAVFLFKQTSEFPGVLALAPCIGAALVIFAGHTQGPVKAVLSSIPFTFVGKISYSFYLIHWPLIVFYRALVTGDHTGFVEAAALFSISMGLSFLCWRYVEQPFRLFRFGQIIIISASLASVTAVFALGAIIVAESGYPSRLKPGSEKMKSLATMWDWKCPHSYLFEGSSYCIAGNSWNSADRKLIVWGDSHAEHLIVMLGQLAKEHNASVLLYRACPFNLGGKYRLNIPDNQAYNNNRTCSLSQARLFRLLSVNPDVQTIIAPSAWINISKKMLMDTGQSGISVFRDSVHDIASRLSALGKRVFIISPAPRFSFDPIPCVMARCGLVRLGCPDMEYAIDVKGLQLTLGATTNALIDGANGISFVSIIDGTKGLCGRKYCTPFLNAEFLFRDTNHFRRNLTSETTSALAKLLGLDSIFMWSPLNPESGSGR